MDVKKSDKADLQNKKGLFFEIGLVVALVFTLLAFNWTTTEKKETLMNSGPVAIIEEEQVPVTNHEPPPPQEIPNIPVVSDQIVIVDDNVDISTDISFDMEDQKNLGVQQMQYVETRQAPVEEAAEVEEVIPFAIVEEKPTFEGGDPNYFSRWVNSKIQYPPAAAENGIQGTVILFFEVGTDGKLYNVKVLRSIDPLLDQEAVRVVKMSPLWKPGRQQNKPVKVSYQFPVKFQLQ